MAAASYAIGIGSNRRHGRHGSPRGIVGAAIAALGDAGCRIVAVSRIERSAALGPAGRDFANAAAIVASDRAPLAMLALLKSVERRFGRRPGGRWRARVLDLDILLWNGGRFASRRLAIPHPALAERRFVLRPLAEIAPDWRVAASGTTVRHLLARLERRRPVDRSTRQP